MYDPSLIPAVMGVLKIALQTKRGPKSALIALTVRNDNTTELLSHHAKGAASSYSSKHPADVYVLQRAMPQG